MCCLNEHQDRLHHAAFMAMLPNICPKRQAGRCSPGAHRKSRGLERKGSPGEGGAGGGRGGGGRRLKEADLNKLQWNQDSMLQAAVDKALGLHLDLPLLQPQGHIHIFLQPGFLLLEESQLGLLAALHLLKLCQFSLQPISMFASM